MYVRIHRLVSQKGYILLHINPKLLQLDFAETKEMATENNGQKKTPRRTKSEVLKDKGQGNSNCHEQ